MCAEVADLVEVEVLKLFGTQIITVQAPDAGDGASDLDAVPRWILVLLWSGGSLLYPDSSTVEYEHELRAVVC